MRFPGARWAGPRGSFVWETARGCRYRGSRATMAVGGGGIRESQASRGQVPDVIRHKGVFFIPKCVTGPNRTFVFLKGK